MSTAVAEVRPAYGFPGSGKKSAGKHEVLSVGKRRSDGFFIEEEEVDEEVLTENSSIGAPSSSSIAGREEGEEEVESKLKEGDVLGCLDALEDSLPIK
jgi:KaiC/GvpD/RAD55 family RecA-like ATPase